MAPWAWLPNFVSGYAIPRWYLDSFLQKGRHDFFWRKGGKDLVRIRFPATNAAAVVQKVVYLGDGRGDFCGACRLSRGDTILCRQGYALSKMLSETPPNALDVCVWDNGKDILRAFEERSLL